MKLRSCFRLQEGTFSALNQVRDVSLFDLVLRLVAFSSLNIMDECSQRILREVEEGNGSKELWIGYRGFGSIDGGDFSSLGTYIENTQNTTLVNTSFRNIIYVFCGVVVLKTLLFTCK